MQYKLSKWQKAALEKLVDQYERSKTYRGENQVFQTFAIGPQKVFSSYDSDYTNVDDVHDFENQMKELEQKGLLFIKWEEHEIQNLMANQQKWKDIYEILERRELRHLEEEQIRLYKSYLGCHAVLEGFCQEQIERLEEGKRAKFELSEAEKILKLCKFILENREEVLERELSIAVLRDSKLWKKYRSKVCRVLKDYGNLDALLIGVDNEESEKVILGEYHIVSNPSYIYFKGNAELLFENGERLKINSNMPVAFTEKTVEYMKSIKILSKKVVTVENLTSFNRLEKEDSFYIFLSGYHNQLKQYLLRRIYEENKMGEWYHFGDIDPDGFYIMEHLKRGTGIPFEALNMNLLYLRKYDAYTKPMEENDIRKAKSLLNQDKYSEVMEYMLQERKKLEQEIISWMEK
jgi:hypothetical protein|nr:Wadjet anti-phage system protein JetD domain-containing protein [uncultured Acetatifactor sp.]